MRLRINIQQADIGKYVWEGNGVLTVMLKDELLLKFTKCLSGIYFVSEGQITPNADYYIGQVGRWLKKS
jgi:hypothetical protein